MTLENNKDQQALYPIREISRLTGVKPITLRAWERRYDLVEPVRTPSGHRLYTENHLAIIKEAMMLVDTGLPISQVKSILTERADLLNQVGISNDISCDWNEIILSAIRAQSYQQIHALTQRMLESNRDYFTLAKNLLELSNESAKALDAFWAEIWLQELNQQLAHRLHLWRQQPFQSKDLILIYCHSDTPNWLNKLMALHCYEQSATPLFMTRCFFNDPVQLVLPKDLTLFKGVIYLLPPMGNNNQEYYIEQLLKPLGSLQSWIMGNETLEGKNQTSVISELRSWPLWFETLVVNHQD